MTDNIDRSDIYAAMAEIEEEDAAERARNNPFAQQKQLNSERSATVTRTNGGHAEVAMFAYVRDLERIVREQARKIEKFERQFNRIAAVMKNQRSTIHGHNNRLNDVARELDQKIDRRD